MYRRISHDKIIKRFVDAEGTDSDGSMSLLNASEQYENLIDVLKADSITMDDSDEKLDMSNTIETMDYNENKYWSEDDAEFAAQKESRSV